MDRLRRCKLAASRAAGRGQAGATKDHSCLVRGFTGIGGSALPCFVGGWKELRSDRMTSKGRAFDPFSGDRDAGPVPAPSRARIRRMVCSGPERSCFLSRVPEDAAGGFVEAWDCAGAGSGSWECARAANAAAQEITASINILCMAVSVPSP